MNGRTLLLIGGIALAQPFLSRAAGPNLPVPKTELPSQLEPLPTLAAFAANHQISLRGFDPSEEGNTHRTGDEITALVHLQTKSVTQQWLVTIRVAEVKAADRRAAELPLVLFTSSGRRLEYGFEPVSLELRTAGPFGSLESRDGWKGKIRMKRARVVINGEFLALGLDGAARTSLRLSSAAKHETGGLGEFSFSSRPFDVKTIERGKRVAQALSLSAAEERAFASMMPALFAFFDVAQSTPGLKEILGKVVDEGSLILSFLRHGGKLEPYFRNHSSQVEQLDPATWGVGNRPVYRFPFELSLNRKPVLNCALAVSAAHSPLIACAGILGLVATPIDDSNTRLAIRVISARSGK